MRLISLLLQVWLEIVDLELEVKRRGIKPAFGPMARFRNKRLLLKAVEEDDRITEDKFQARFERRGGKTVGRATLALEHSATFTTRCCGKTRCARSR